MDGTDERGETGTGAKTIEQVKATLGACAVRLRESAGTADEARVAAEERDRLEPCVVSLERHGSRVDDVDRVTELGVALTALEEGDREFTTAVEAAEYAEQIAREMRPNSVVGRERRERRERRARRGGR